MANALTRRSDYGSDEGVAYNAYSAAETPEDKAAALAKLGRILEKAEEPTTALEAYHESLKLAFDRAHRVVAARQRLPLGRIHAGNTASDRQRTPHERSRRSRIHP